MIETVGVDDLTETSTRRLGVSGTDTGIGKTVVTSALAARARALGIAVAAMKPVESGAEQQIPSFAASDGYPSNGPSMDGYPSDVLRLHGATGGIDDVEVMCPYSLVEPLAPLIAAKRAGVTIDLAVLDSAMLSLSNGRELLLIEGAGGVMVPITPDTTVLDLFARWNCEMILVAGNRLGVLNHVLLSVRAAEAAGVTVRAIILTEFGAVDALLAQATNYDALCTLLPSHDIFRFPFVDRVDDFDALAAAVQGSGLDDLFSCHLPSR